MKKRLLFLLLPTILYLFITAPLLVAEDTSSACASNDTECLQKKVNEKHEQGNTLASQIQEMNAQITLKTLAIQNTESKIAETQHEIDTLTARIDGLDTSLNTLSKLLIQRVVNGYKKQPLSMIDIFLGSQTMGDLVNTLKYQKTTQNNNQHLLFQVQEAKTNYEEQKMLRETKKKELDNLMVTLDIQKDDLISQQSAKTRLLEVTRNDEATYQQLLEQARRQQSSFTSFVQSAGGGVIGADGFGKGKEGWYYSQRDERWAYRRIGGSDMNLLQVGCLISNVAMAYRRSGESATPADIASQMDRFFSNTAMMLVPWHGPGGKSYTGLSTSQIDNELSQNNPVIVGVYAGSYGTHYVTLVKKDGNDYIMYDPFYGPDLMFSTRYNFGSIFSAATFK